MSVESNNKQLNEVSSDKFKIIEGYIDNIRSRYHINLNIHDIAGLSVISPAMENILSPYLYHNNSFCNYIKRNDKNFEMCVKNKEKLCKCCKETVGPFYGRCYMGVEEFVFPVKWEDKLIAIICVGQFFDNVNYATDLLEEKAKTYGLNETQCVERYLDIASSVNFSIKEMCYDIGVLCQHLLYIYMDYVTQGKIDTNFIDSSIGVADEYKSTYIIESTIRFIKENYNRELSLSLLATNSFCNSAYLSHVFKEKTGVNITDYINKIRIGAAKQILDTTTKTITDTCFLVGYNDSNYFSRVFKNMTSFTPKEYRNRKT